MESLQFSNNRPNLDMEHGGRGYKLGFKKQLSKKESKLGHRQTQYVLINKYLVF